MPQVEVLVYRDDDGSAPLVDWLAALPDETRDRCLARLQLLEQHGHDLRRPHCENLGDGIYFYCNRFFVTSDHVPSTLNPLGVCLSRSEVRRCRSWITPRRRPSWPMPLSPPTPSGIEPTA